jgi:hypothetical protein
MRFSSYLKGAVIVSMAATLIGAPIGSAVAKTGSAGALTVSPNSVDQGSTNQMQLTFTTTGGGGVKCVVFTIPSAFTGVTAVPPPVAPTSGWTVVDFGTDGSGNSLEKLSGNPAIGTGLAGSINIQATAPNVVNTSPGYIFSALAYTDRGCTKLVFSGEAPATTTVTTNAGGLNPTSTVLSCDTATPTVSVPDNCTVTLTDTAGSPQSFDSGTVMALGVAGGGSVTGSTCGSLAGGASPQTCSFTYKATTAGSKVLTASFAGDSKHSGSNASYGLLASPKGSGPGHFRPDNLIRNAKKGSRWFGEGIFNGTGRHQRVHVFEHAGQTKSFLIRVENDGSSVDTIVVGGRGLQHGFRVVKYTLGKRNITRAVVGHGYAFKHMAPGSQRTIKLTITSFRHAGAAFRTWQVLSRSTGNPFKRDAVAATITIRK